MAAEVDERLRAEVGQSPSSALRSASRPPVTAVMTGVPAGTRAKSLVDARRAALEAGAADSGVDTLRMACRVAEAAADWGLLAACRRELGTALMHAVRSRDDEGSLLLTHALAGAVEIGDRATATAAARELGYADTLAGRRLLAATHLHAAEEHAGGDGALLSGIVAGRAFNLAEWGWLDAGLADYEQAIALARSAGRTRDLAWALGLGAWARIAAGQYDLAADWAEECLRLTDDLRWMAFRPWPIAVRAELNVVLERVDSIEPLYEAYALSCQLGDPCWEGASARSLALAADARGEIEEAFAWLDRAITACRRETDTFAGMHAAVLATSRRAGRPDRARATARTLLELSARHHLDRHLDIALAAMGRSPSGAGFLM